MTDRRLPRSLGGPTNRLGCSKSECVTLSSFAYCSNESIDALLAKFVPYIASSLVSGSAIANIGF